VVGRLFPDERSYECGNIFASGEVCIILEVLATTIAWIAYYGKPHQLARRWSLGSWKDYGEIHDGRMMSLRDIGVLGAERDMPGWASSDQHVYYDKR